MRLPSTDGATLRRSTSLRGLAVGWLGHSTFMVTSPNGVRVLFDPWIATNPSCPASGEKSGRC